MPGAEDPSNTCRCVSRFLRFFLAFYHYDSILLNLYEISLTAIARQNSCHNFRKRLVLLPGGHLNSMSNGAFKPLVCKCAVGLGLFTVAIMPIDCFSYSPFAVKASCFGASKFLGAIARQNSAQLQKAWFFCTGGHCLRSREVGTLL